MPGRRSADLLSLAIYGIQSATPGIPPSQYSAVATTLVLNVVLGGALWASAAITRKNLMNGAIVAGVGQHALVYFYRQARAHEGGGRDFLPRFGGGQPHPHPAPPRLGPR